MALEKSGVNSVPEAGGQKLNVDDITLEDLGFETGEDPEGEAGLETQNDSESELTQEEPDGDTQFGDQRQEKAWAKRIAAEREKIRREVDEEYQRKTQEQQYSRTQYQPPQPKAWVEPQPLSKEELDKLAENYAMTPDAIQVLYSQQVELNRMKHLLDQSFMSINSMREDTNKGETIMQIERTRRNNPDLPVFDEGKVAAIRQNYLNRHGIRLTWEDAYKQQVAEEAMSGNLSRQAQQKAIKQITSRNRTNVQAGNAGQAKPVSVEELSDEQFERLKERAKAGVFTRNKQQT